MKRLTLLGLLSILSLTTFSQTNVGGTITENQHWTLAGSPYSLTSTFGVPSGIALTVDPGVEVNGSFDLLVKGSIRLNGSETEPITFSNTRLIFKSADLALSKVEFVEFESSSGIQLADESEFNNDDPKNSKTLIVRHCSFSGSAYARTKGYQTTAKLRLENCTLTNADVRGYYPRSEKIEIVNSMITSSSLISDSYNYGIEISGSTINLSTFSLGCCGSNFNLTDCTVSESSFTDFNSHYSLSLTRVTLTNTYIDLSSGTVTISDCRFSASSIPVSTLIRMNGGSINNSTLEGNSSLTLVETSGSTAIQGVNFKSYDIGLVVNNFTTISISENNFIGGGSFNLKNLTNKNIDATNNFWGTVDETVISEMIVDLYDNINYGIVDYSGYKTGPIVTNPLPVPSSIFKGEQSDGTFLTWSNLADPDVAGYKLYSKVQDTYTLITDMGKVNSFLVSEPLESEFVVTSYSSVADGIDDQLDGSESAYSVLAVDFFQIAGAASACEQSDFQLTVTRNYNFSSLSSFYLVSSLTEDFSDQDTLAIVPASSNSVAWTIPGIEASTATLYYRLIADELEIFSEVEQLSVNAAPSISFDIGAPNCFGVPVTALGIENEDLEVSWDLDGATLVSTSGNSFEVAWDTSGDRTLTLSASQNGCETTLQKELFFEVVEPLMAPEICEVQFDEASGKNRISWNYDSPRLLKFRLYRESPRGGDYLQVAELSSSESSYVDEESNPHQQAFRYKLAAIDNCEIETVAGEAVTSVHLQLTAGADGNWNLHWAGTFEHGTVEVYRQTVGDWVRIAELPGGHTLFTDIGHHDGSAFYQIKFIALGSPTCPVSSNIVFNGITSIETDMPQFAVYPNPAEKQVSFNSATQGSFSVFNGLGIQVMRGPVWAGDNIIEIGELQPGAYLLKVRSHDGRLHVSKLMRQH